MTLLLWALLMGICAGGQVWVTHLYDNPGYYTCERLMDNDPCFDIGNCQVTDKCPNKDGASTFQCDEWPEGDSIYGCSDNSGKSWEFLSGTKNPDICQNYCADMQKGGCCGIWSDLGCYFNEDDVVSTDDEDYGLGSNCQFDGPPPESDDDYDWDYDWDYEYWIDHYDYDYDYWKWDYDYWSDHYDYDYWWDHHDYFYDYDWDYDYWYDYDYDYWTWDYDYDYDWWDYDYVWDYNVDVVCADDPHWIDSKYGTGTDDCTGVAANPTWCTHYGMYSYEAKRYCPVACGVCEGEEHQYIKIEPATPRAANGWSVQDVLVYSDTSCTAQVTPSSFTDGGNYGCCYTDCLNSVEDENCCCYDWYTTDDDGYLQVNLPIDQEVGCLEVKGMGYDTPEQVKLTFSDGAIEYANVQDRNVAYINSPHTISPTITPTFTPTFHPTEAPISGATTCKGAASLDTRGEQEAACGSLGQCKTKVKKNGKIKCKQACNKIKDEAECEAYDDCKAKMKKDKFRKCKND